MLSKQVIRSNVFITRNGEETTKDELIKLSENWTEQEEILFRKMLKQGGKFGIQGNKFKVTTVEKLINSRGNVDAAAIPMDHSGDDVDKNYLK